MTERYQLLYDATEIKQTIGRMASEITARHDGKKSLFVPLMRGAIPFASELFLEMGRQAPDFHTEVDYMMTSRDRRTIDSKPRIKTDLDPNTEVEGRDVVIVDAMLSMGETAKFVRDHLIDLGARYVELAVLVEKDIERTSPIEADYVGFKTADQWLVGMGMEDDAVAKEHFRWRNGIWIVTPEEPQLQHALVDA